METDFKKLTGVVPIEIAEVNDCVQFGKFAWEIIAIEDGKKLLLSKECMTVDMDWEFAQEDEEDLTEHINVYDEGYADSEFAAILRSPGSVDKYAKALEKLRKYFREWFCKECFSQSDLERIIPQHFKMNDTSANDFDDLFFLLSKEEVEKYLPDRENRISTLKVLYFDVKRPWALRLDDTSYYPFIVDNEGEIVMFPYGYIDYFRPAVWVK